MLLPGIASDAAVWRGAADGLVMVSEADNIEDSAAGILERAPARFALAGHSLGGYVALAVVRAAPERVTRLALLSSSAGADDMRQKAMRGRVAAASEQNFTGLLATLAKTMVHPETYPTLHGVLLEMMSRVGRDAFVRQQRAAAERPDAQAALSSIRVPTLILTGEDDKIIPPQRSAEMAQAIAGARFVRLPRCGHVPTLERPQQTRDALDAWMASPPDPPSVPVRCSDGR